MVKINILAQFLILVVKSNIPANAVFKIPIINQLPCHFTALTIHAESLTNINKNILKWSFPHIHVLSLFLLSFRY